LLFEKEIPCSSVLILSASDECAAAGDWQRQVCRGSRGAVWISPDPSPAFPAPATDGHVPPQYKLPSSDPLLLVTPEILLARG
jgi:hypothetical protein